MKQKELGEQLIMRKILVTKSTIPEFDEYIAEIRDIWKSRWLTNMGPKHELLREKLKEYLGVEHIDLFTNGHMSLELSLQSFGFEEGSEVITTPFSFVSTTHAIVRSGLKPVFCDIKEDDYTIDENKIEKLINDKTVAIMPVHVYGNICNVDRIEEIAKRNNLKVIYDAAHAFGVKYNGVSIARYGDISCFSFHATKVFNTIEGGAACFRDKDIAYKLYGLKNFGIRSEDVVDNIGANAKMNEFCAAMGLCNLRKINENILLRKRVYERYNSNLQNVRGIRLNIASKETESNYAYYPILINETEYGMNRDQLKAKLETRGIYTRKYFYPAINEMECYKDMGFKGKTPIASAISKKILTLPLYPDLELETVDYICSLIKGNWHE